MVCGGGTPTEGDGSRHTVNCSCFHPQLLEEDCLCSGPTTDPQVPEDKHAYRHCLGGGTQLDQHCWHDDGCHGNHAAC